MRALWLSVFLIGCVEDLNPPETMGGACDADVQCNALNRCGPQVACVAGHCESPATGPAVVVKVCDGGTAVRRPDADFAATADDDGG